MKMAIPTNVPDFMEELDGSNFQNKFANILSDVAMSVINQHRSGKVTLTFNLKQLGDSDQVIIDHKIEYRRPTAKGNIGEDDATQTPMYVNKGGRLTLFPDDEEQQPLFSVDSIESVKIKEAR
jgi:hypothetical protein